MYASNVINSSADLETVIYLEIWVKIGTGGKYLPLLVASTSLFNK